MHKRQFTMAAALLPLFWAAAPALAQRSSKGDAEAMVKRAIAYVKKNGKEKAFAVFSDPKGEFAERDLYVSVFDMNGVNLAHGSNPKIVGKNLWDYRDQDGKYPIRECLQIAKSKGSGWTEFTFLNPTTKQLQAKDVYVERLDDIAIWVGAYK